MKFILVVRIHKTFPLSSNISTTDVGYLIKTIKSRFIKPIPNTSIMSKGELFFIEEVIQDAENELFIFYENMTTTKEDLQDLKKDYESRGWIWQEKLEILKDEDAKIFRYSKNNNSQLSR